MNRKITAHYTLVNNFLSAESVLTVGQTGGADAVGDQADALGLLDLVDQLQQLGSPTAYEQVMAAVSALLLPHVLNSQQTVCCRNAGGEQRAK